MIFAYSLRTLHYKSIDGSILDDGQLSTIKNYLISRERRKDIKNFKVIRRMFPGDEMMNIIERYHVC